MEGGRRVRDRPLSDGHGECSANPGGVVVGRPPEAAGVEGAAHDQRTATGSRAGNDGVAVRVVACDTPIRHRVLASVFARPRRFGAPVTIRQRGRIADPRPGEVFGECA